jgi:hypothetical protein
MTATQQVKLGARLALISVSQQKMADTTQEAAPEK